MIFDTDWIKRYDRLPDGEYVEHVLYDPSNGVDYSAMYVVRYYPYTGHYYIEERA